MDEFIVRYHEDELGIVRSCDEVGQLIRCKDCKWLLSYHGKADNSDRICCENIYGLDRDVSEDDYCSYGERRTDEND